MPDPIVKTVRRELQKLSDAKTKTSFQRFFKENVSFHGVKAALVAKTAKKYFPEVKPLGKTKIFALCEQLLASGYCEEAFVAGQWVYALHKDYTPDDFKLLEKWVHKYVSNWAVCDTLCNHTIGEFVSMYPQYVKKLLVWAKSKNRWARRASAVTLILPARHGIFLKEAFAIADILLRDEDDLVQKGYGWLLKEAGKPHQTEVFKYLMQHKAVMPRTALRYAIEKMPVQLKRKVLKKDL